jgi:hypothetical protein
MTIERQPPPPPVRPPPREIGAVLLGDLRATGRAYRARLWREDVRAIETRDVYHLVDRTI